MPKLTEDIKTTKADLLDVVEQWIDQNTSPGKLATFKTMRLEGGSEYVYAQKVDGLRFGQFGIHVERGHYNVTHIKTGGLVGTFTTEKAARRLVYCLSGLTDWKKIVWSDDPPYLKDQKLLQACRESVTYCSGLPTECPTLLELIKPHVSSDVDEEVELEPVAFGSGVKAPVKKRVATPISSEKSGWGVRVTA